MIHYHAYYSTFLTTDMSSVTTIAIIFITNTITSLSIPLTTQNQERLIDHLFWCLSLNKGKKREKNSSDLMCTNCIDMQVPMHQYCKSMQFLGGILIHLMLSSFIYGDILGEIEAWFNNVLPQEISWPQKGDIKAQVFFINTEFCFDSIWP